MTDDLKLASMLTWIYTKTTPKFMALALCLTTYLIPIQMGALGCEVFRSFCSYLSLYYVQKMVTSISRPFFSLLLAMSEFQ
jgi:hypothetical protein